MVLSAQKAKNVVTLSVDKVYTNPGVGEAGFFKTDTADPLYLGGLLGKILNIGLSIKM